MSVASKLTKYITITPRLWNNNRGDTIVEVLLAIAVVSAVLGGAYVSANRSSNNTRQAQERSEASKLVEAQLEQLKQATQNDPTFFTLPAATTYCLDGSLNRQLNPDTNAACVAPGGRYRLKIERNGNSFTAMAHWDRFGGGASGGGGQEEVKIVYRLYP